MVHVWKCVPFLVLFSVWVMHMKFSEFFHIVFFYSLCFNLKFVDYALSIHRKALPFSFLPQNFRKQPLHLETSQRPAGRLDQLSVLLYVPKGIIPRVHRYSRPAVFHGINNYDHTHNVLCLNTVALECHFLFHFFCVRFPWNEREYLVASSVTVVRTICYFLKLEFADMHLILGNKALHISEFEP